MRNILKKLIFLISILALSILIQSHVQAQVTPTPNPCSGMTGAQLQTCLINLGANQPAGTPIPTQSLFPCENKEGADLQTCLINLGQSQPAGLPVGQPNAPGQNTDGDVLNDPYPVKVWQVLIVRIAGIIAGDSGRNKIADLLFSSWHKNQSTDVPDFTYDQVINEKGDERLTYSEIKSKTQNRENPLIYSEASVVCIDGQEILSKTPMYTDDIEPLKILDQTSQSINAKFNPLYTRADANYEKQTDLIYAGAAAGGCVEPDKSKEHQSYTLSEYLCHPYWGGACGQMFSLGEESDDGYIMYEGRTEAENIACYLAGKCKADKQLAKSPKSKTDKQAYEYQDGFTSTFLPSGIVQDELFHGGKKNIYEATYNSPKELTSRFNLLEWTRKILKQGYCSNMFSELQPKVIAIDDDLCIGEFESSKTAPVPKVTPSVMPYPPQPTISPPPQQPVPTSTPPPVPPGPFAGGLDNCSDVLPLQEYLDISRGPDGVTGTTDDWPTPSSTNELTYSFDYTNTSCTLDPNASLYALCFALYRVGGHGDEAMANFKQDWQQVQSLAVQNGINPVLALSLAAHESAFGAISGDYLGARGGGSITSQMQQLSNTINSTGGYEQLLCRWKAGNATCPPFPSNFPDGMRLWLDMFSQGLPPECGPQPLSSP